MKEEENRVHSHSTLALCNISVTTPYPWSASTQPAQLHSLHLRSLAFHTRSLQRLCHHPISLVCFYTTCPASQLTFTFTRIPHSLSVTSLSPPHILLLLLHNLFDFTPYFYHSLFRSPKIRIHRLTRQPTPFQVAFCNAQLLLRDIIIIVIIVLSSS